MSTYFGIDHHSNRLLRICAFIQVHCAQSIRMAHDRYAGVILNIADETVASAGDYKVDIPIESQQRANFIARLDSLYVIRMEIRLR